MATVDMSAKAVTARLKLVSELRELCLLLGTAKIESKPSVQHRRTKKSRLKHQKNFK